MRELPEKTEWHSRTNPGLSGWEEAVRQRSLLSGRSVIPTLRPHGSQTLRPAQ